LQKTTSMELKIGIENELEIIITPQDTAKSYGSGRLDVFATPAMIALMEKTALQLAAPFLTEGKDTVGTEINVKHIKATAIGQRVQCYAKLKEVDRNKLKFIVEAYDEKGLIGTGTHNRYIIDIAKFISSLS